MKALLVRIAPYVIALSALGWIASRYSVARIRDEIVQGDAGGVAVVAACTVLITIFFAGCADWIVFRRFNRALPYFHVVRAKAASVLLDLVNYAAGKGGYGIWLARRQGVSPGRATGVMVHVAAAELCVTASIAVTALQVSGLVVDPLLQYGLIAAAVLSGVSLLVNDTFTPLRNHPFVSGYHVTSGLTVVVELLARLGQQLVFMSATYIAARTFGIEIPVGVFLTYLPIIGIVGALPVNVAGFGAVQSAWLVFEPWAAGEHLIAFSVVWGVLLGVALSLRGLPFVGIVTEEAREGVAEPVPAESESESDAGS